MADIFELLKKISSENKAESTAPVSFIVAGLGNPGAKYTFTRHNAGFLAVDYISQKHGFECKKYKFKSLTGEAVINGVRVLFMKPETYMNNSGVAIREAADFYKVPAENILVISDDVSLPAGKVLCFPLSLRNSHGLVCYVMLVPSECPPDIQPWSLP